MGRQCGPPEKTRSVRFSVLGILGAWAQDCWYPMINPLLPGSQRDLFTVLFVTQWVPANNLSLPLSLAGQMFSFLIILAGKVAGSIGPEA